MSEQTAKIVKHHKMIAGPTKLHSVPLSTTQFFLHETFLQRISSARPQCPVTLSLFSSGRKIHSPWAHSLHEATQAYGYTGQAVSLSKPRIKNSTDVFKFAVPNRQQSGITEHCAQPCQTPVDQSYKCILAIGNYK